ncbi:MAG: hypothetical protein IJM35_06595 [Bacteroidales bacterium]|nr:hypothetical protein [Bacteroidales bacterium]
MLNRRILRIKAFKVLYSSAEDGNMSLKDAQAILDASCEATRDLYLLMMSFIGALVDEASRRIEAARGKFNPTEEDLSPNMKFVRNRMAGVLLDDPDFVKLLERKKLTWDQNDALVRQVYDSVRSSAYFAEYMADPDTSLRSDARLFTRMYEEEFEDNEQLQKVLEDMSIFWTDDLAYVLGTCIKSFGAVAREGRWTLPPLYQSDILTARGVDADSDRRFVTRLLTNAYNGMERYSSMIAGAVSRWDSDRIFVTDTVLIAMGLAEAESFPEIPVKVTINEYVEISKYYSTPKSRSFVNGLLDTLIQELVAEGRVVKTGRGLN